MNQIQKYSNFSLSVPERRLQKEIERVEAGAIVRSARVMAERMVASQKLTEIDALARDAITSQVMLAHWADTLAGNNQLLHDEISIYRDVARLGKAQIIADVIDTFSHDRRL
jgi:hypothetical protein